jgi:hypothetical protein
MKLNVGTPVTMTNEQEMERMRLPDREFTSVSVGALTPTGGCALGVAAGAVGVLVGPPPHGEMASVRVPIAPDWPARSFHSAEPGWSVSRTTTLRMALASGGTPL